MNYYNEFDPFAAEWLENLIKAGEIPAGFVDTRSISDVHPEDLAGYTQCHFFAGIGGWPLALKLAGWPEDREVWTGSCPCQPFSAAGKGKGVQDERHLWPEFIRLIAQRRPTTVFGEQVASAAGRAWCAGVRADCEALGYRFAAVDICAAGVGAPHIRQRLYWVADLLRAGRPARGPSAGDGQVAGGGGVGGLGDGDGDEADAIRSVDQRRRDSMGRPEQAVSEREPGHDGLDGPGEVSRLAQEPDGLGRGRGSDGDTAGGRREVQATGLRPVGGVDDRAMPRHEPAGSGQQGESERRRRLLGLGCEAGGLGDGGEGLQDGRQGRPQSDGGPVTPWSDYRVVPCTDGKARRTGTRVFPLAHGIPRGVGALGSWRPGLARGASKARIGMLKGAGNAIVPSLAAVFIRAFSESAGLE